MVSYNVFRFEFDDIWQECYKPGWTFGEDSSLLVHCHEGISRSSAIAIAIYTSLYRDPHNAVKRVSHQRSQADPNIEVIRQTDDLLNMQGKLYDAVSEVFYHKQD